jgi:hypothetical protein
MNQTKKTKFMILCYILLAISCVISGDTIEALSVTSAAYASECCLDDKQQKIFYALAALGNIPHWRFLGVLGYLFSALHRYDIANVLLAFHYSLIFVDDEELTAIGRLAALGLALSFAF